MRVIGGLLVFMGILDWLAGRPQAEGPQLISTGLAFLAMGSLMGGARNAAVSRLGRRVGMVRSSDHEFRPLGFPALALYDGPRRPRVRDLMQSTYRGGRLSLFDDMSTEYEVAMTPSQTVVTFEHEGLPRFRWLLQPRFGLSGGRRGNPSFVQAPTGDPAFDRRYHARYADVRDAAGFPTPAQRAMLLSHRGLTLDGRAGLVALYRANRPVTVLGRGRFLAECKRAIDCLLLPEEDGR